MKSRQARTGKHENVLKVLLSSVGQVDTGRSIASRDQGPDGNPNDVENDCRNGKVDDQSAAKDFGDSITIRLDQVDAGNLYHGQGDAYESVDPDLLFALKVVGRALCGDDETEVAGNGGCAGKNPTGGRELQTNVNIAPNMAIPPFHPELAVPNRRADGVAKRKIGQAQGCPYDRHVDSAFSGRVTAVAVSRAPLTQTELEGQDD